MTDEGMHRIISSNNLLIPFTTARLIDLAVRREGGNLTNAESLAFAVLAGGQGGIDAIQQLIDATTEEFGRGLYRVPVQVVADHRKCKVFLNLPNWLPENECDRIARALERWWQHPSKHTMVVNCGATLQVFEFGDREKAGVEIRTLAVEEELNPETET